MRWRPPQFAVGNVLLEVTTLNGENALRVRDPASTAAEHLAPIQYFPLDESWRIVADWVPFAAPKGVTVDTTKSIPTEVGVTH